MERASSLVEFGIPGLAIAVALCVLVASAFAGNNKTDRRFILRRFIIGGLCLAIWLTTTALIARSGILRNNEVFPPPIGILLVTLFITATILAFSQFGKQLAALPLSFLVGIQAFRLPLELVMHQAATEGIMPKVMSYEGLNYDIVTGATALGLGFLLYMGVTIPKWVLYFWNTMGLILVLTIVTIAVRASPLFMAYGTEPNQVNTWVLYFPYVWLPTVLVVIAFTLHLIIYRALAKRPSLD